MDIIDLTNDYQKVKDKISRSRAFGGGDDGPEDLNGALRKSKTMKFKSKTLLIYLMCDAPFHGDDYTMNA